MLSGHAPQLGAAAAGIGILLVALGTLSAVDPLRGLYADPLTGYDPPFDGVAGVLLIVLSVRIRDRTSVAWLFSLLAPFLTGAIAILSPNPYAIAAAVAASVYVAVIYPYRSGFYRGSATGPQGTGLAVLVAGLLSLLFGTVGARWLGSQFTPPMTGWAQSLYFTVTTISTNGSTIDPVTDTARLFVVVLVLLGVGTFLSAIVVVFLPFLEQRLAHVAERLERAQMQELEQHVVVAGASPEAYATARALRDAGVRPVIIAPDPKSVEVLKGEGFRTHLGDPSVENELRLVGIDRARALVVAQASDAENLLTVITARALRPELRIVAVASAESNLAKLRRAGANEAISVVSVAAHLMSAAALEQGDTTTPHTHSIPH